MPPTLGETFNGVVDLSHHNGSVDLKKASDSGIVGVIHKATQGRTYVDPTYKGNRTKAADAGLLWGAYHFGTGSDGVLQAEHFLNAVQPANDTLVVLDLEANPQGPNMTLVEARAFVTHVNEVTGRWPGLYSGHYIKALLGTQTDAVLANCWFWLAQYGPTPVVPTNWKKWTMWQYTDGGIGPPPHTVTGIGRCDRDRFNGTKAQLRAFWKHR
jgi:GH25 family lysozyme M1 (1,4-beta-N-acetylmuramidase)